MSSGINFKNEKSFRLINMYERLNKGEVLIKNDLLDFFGISDKTLQRDFSDLRAYYSEIQNDVDLTIIYNKKINGYYLSKYENNLLSNKDILALCKVLLESRAFNKGEMSNIINKLLSQATINDSLEIKEIINKELFYYVPLRHNKNLLDMLWTLTQFINKKEYIEITYTRKDNVQRVHQIKPVALMFSEFYFYVVSYMADETKEDPTVFRVDRIQNIKGLKKHFKVPYINEFNDGEFRQRVQFMFTGKLNKVKFEYSGQSIESILDRLPTAKVIKESNEIYTLEAESYGNGIYMWLNAQGDIVKVID